MCLIRLHIGGGRGARAQGKCGEEGLFHLYPLTLDTWQARKLMKKRLYC
jgi:hypothetical protein